MRAPQRTVYAEAIVLAAHKARVPSLLLVAIIENESHWHTGAVSPDGKTIGLGQVALGTYPACRADRESKACAAVRAMLFDGAANIAAMGTVLRANRKHCGRKISHILAGYQSGRCKPVAVTWRVLRRYRALGRAVRRRHRYRRKR
jgi:hypothetical protein